MHFAVDHGNVSEALEKFKKLRRVNDRVGDWRFFDQLFLRDLSAEVSAFPLSDSWSVPTTDNAT